MPVPTHERDRQDPRFLAHLSRHVHARSWGRAGYLAVALCVLLVSAGCGASDQDSSKPETAGSSKPAEDSLYGAPEVGACRNLAVKDTDQESVEKFVPCDGVYTSKVAAVVTLPDDLVDVDPSDRRFIEHTYKVCAKPGRETVGGTQYLRRTSLFHLLTFIPTAEQTGRGARWLACDVAADDDEGLIPLPEETPFLTKRSEDTRSLKRFAQCIRLIDKNSGTVVACDKRHSTRPGFVLEFPDQQSATALTPVKACKSRSPKNGPEVILGGINPRRSAFDDDLPWIITCQAWDFEDGKM